MIVSVCVSTYRGADRLRRLRTSVGEGAAETIVVDDGSPKEDAQAIALECLRWPHAERIAVGENRGYARCMNDAVARARGEVILLCDDDVTLPAGFFWELRRLMALPGVGVISWRSRGSNPGQSLRDVPGFLQPATQLASYCMAVRKEIWDSVQGLDPRFKFFCIDSDLCVRVTEKGYPCYRAWWPLVPHTEHGTEVPFSRDEARVADTALFVEKWGCDPVEMERRALKSLEERAR